MGNKYYISTIEYDEENLILEIEWTINVAWKFYDVPKDQYVELLHSLDREEYYRNNIMKVFKGRQKWRSLDELLSICAGTLLIDDTNLSVKSTNCSNESAIHLAAYWGDLEAVELLILSGSDIDQPGDCDCSPLYNAVMSNSSEVVDFLLKAGADPHSTNDIGYTPYELAINDNKQKIVEIFERNLGLGKV